MKSHSHAEIKAQIKDSKGLIVEDMVQEDSVNILVGDSGIGKTPLLMQLGLCVSAGLPFLGLATRPGPVLYVDHENAKSDLSDILDNLLIHVGLDIAPETLRFLHFPGSLAEMEQEIAAMKPLFVIVDSVRGMDPQMEKDNTSAGSRIAYLYRLAEKYHCAFLLLHHIRKVDPKEPPPKIAAATNVMDWLQQSSGARALINQTEARFGIEEYTVGTASLAMRGHFKLRGEVGPWMLERVFNEYDDALGYSRISGLQLLSQIERDRFNKLPATFRWKEAQQIIAPGIKGGKAISQLLRRAQAAGLLLRTGRKPDLAYQKVSK